MLERLSTPFAHRPVPQPFLHVHPWRSPTALLSEPPAAASTRTTLASRASCIPSRPSSRVRSASWLPLVGTQFQIMPPAFVVIPMPSFPPAEQFLLIVMHEFLHFILHVTIFVNNPTYPLDIFCFPLLFPRLRLLLIPSHLFLHCSDNLTHPCSCLFTFLDCVARVNTSVSMRACALAWQPNSNLSRVGDRPYT